MKAICFFIVIIASLKSIAQKGDELLVYSLKGNASVIENDKESKLKIGKVLKPGAIIKTQADARITLICKEGKPISVTKAGSFPVARWKDSCYTSQNSVSVKYFQYIWDQLYMRSEEYKNDHAGATASVVRGEPSVAGDEADIYFDQALDTIYYNSGSFPLSWTANINYTGRYYFRLSNAKGNKIVYQDSITGNTVQLDMLRKYMKQGLTYNWTISTKRSPVVTGGTIKYCSAQAVAQRISKLQKLVDVPEDEAALYFRTAYLLENDQYVADAFVYYQKAAAAAPDITLYQERLNEFKLQFQLIKSSQPN